MTPLVSIIIPTYNRAHLIKQTLNSVLKQSYTNWECIVVDDGSTDNTGNVITEYCAKDARFQYHHRPNDRPKGANACRNYGFELSKGDYIQWFDSDDLMYIDKLKHQIEYALLHKADVVVTSHTITQRIKQVKQGKENIFSKENFYINYILGKHPVLTGEVMLERSIVSNYKFDENLHKAQEFDFFSRVFEQKLTYCFVNTPLYYYRQSDDSISKAASKGSDKQSESLIYLSKKLQNNHKNNELIVKRAKHQARKTYKWLVKHNKIKKLVIHFSFFKDAYQMPYIKFFLFFMYNIITKKGFDKMKQGV